MVALSLCVSLCHILLYFKLFRKEKIITCNSKSRRDGALLTVGRDLRTEVSPEIKGLSRKPPIRHCEILFLTTNKRK
jgi:hypothetical protein